MQDDFDDLFGGRISTSRNGIYDRPRFKRAFRSRLFDLILMAVALILGAGVIVAANYWRP